jgi:DNA-directed RNA polymerase sigma subunit (sigma70/sigma32)
VISLKHVHNMSRKHQPDISFEEIDENSEESGVTLDAFLILNCLIEVSTEQQVEIREHLKLVASVIKTLEPCEREIFFRRFVYDEKPTHISRDYPGLKTRSVSQKLTRVKQKIIVLCDMMEGLG